MRREIEKRSAPGPSSSLPLRHRLRRDRLAEGGLDGADCANPSALEQRPGTLVRGMVAVIESDRRDDLRLSDDVNNGASLARPWWPAASRRTRACRRERLRPSTRRGIDWAR